ncbi:MAG: DUF3082 domain-containing protein [Pseudanabaenaceae cyanobacterium]
MDESPKPLRNLTGAGIAFVIALALYWLTSTMGEKLAVNPIAGNTIAFRLSVVVRSALLAVGTGGTMVFGMVALGLVLLTIRQAFSAKGE